MDGLNDGRYVTELRPCDVLFGRGSGPNDHEGNIRFRQLVAERKSEYMATSHRVTKATIAKEIVDQVFAANGRFMKKVEPSELKAMGLSEESDVWEIVGDDTVMEKAKQALRQNNQKGKDHSISPLRAGPRSVSPHSGTSPQRSRSPMVPNRSSTGYPSNVRQPSINLDEIEPIPLTPQPGGQPQLVQSRLNTPPSWGRQRGFVTAEPRNMPVNVSQPLYENNLPDYELQMPRRNVKQPEGGKRGSITMHELSKFHEGGKRGSITMHELSKFHERRHAIEIQEMTDSFKSMKTSEKNLGMLSSTDTMGTIEPIGGAGDMSIGTMESSTFSFFRGNDSVIDDAELDEKIAQIEAQVGQYRKRPGRPGSSFASTASSLQNMSIGSLGTDFGSDFRRLSAMSTGSNNSALFSGKDLDFLSPSGGYQPGTVPELGESAEDFDDFEIGSSSLSHLKSALSLDTNGASESIPPTEDDGYAYGK
jgi:hypothetical protein